MTETKMEVIKLMPKEYTQAEADAFKHGFFLGANWQKEQFEKDYTNLCNGIATAKGLAITMAYDKGMADAKEQMLAKAVEWLMLNADEYIFDSIEEHSSSMRHDFIDAFKLAMKDE